MSEPFIAEIKIFAGNFAPRGWAFCDGQFLPLAQNTVLFSVIGTTYGGDGRTSIALPDLQGRAAMHPGRGPDLTYRRLGQKAGTETISLTESQIPVHSHILQGDTTTVSDSNIPDNTKVFAKGVGDGGKIYQKNTSENLTDMASEAISTAGGDQAHTNMQPFIAMNFIIALQGLYPSRS